MGLSTYGEVFENFDEALKFALEKEPSLLLPKEMLEF
jgi:predicted RNase H-like HicB family nuclease